ncbi:MAG: hypothetical protein A2279_11155 [Stygiobacter sp. RIFOXYA12_FULL_38_9]|nr:MAG: hypothetical protein A2279_11155 [Stygiobacter sp. RIFOXYA12_FULL_38_9]
MKYLILLAVFVFITTVSLAQTGSIKGKIIDAKTKQPLPGANISVIDEKFGAVSDLDGYYFIEKVPENVYKLKISFIGYNTYVQPDFRVIRSKTTYVKEIELEETSILVNEVEIVAGLFNQTQDMPVSSYMFDREEIKRAPGSAGDIFRAVETIPGVSSSGGEFSAFSVRGSAPRENIILVDNIPFSSISHFSESSGNEEIQGGRFSIFTSGLVENAKFQGGGFGAKYGGKNASFLDLSIKEGNRESFSINGTYDFLGWEANYDGPAYLFGNTGVVVSARHQDFKTILNIMDELDHGHPKFSDYLFKMTSDINQNHKISLLGIYATETYQRTKEHIFKNSNPENGEIGLETEDKTLAGLNWRWLTGSNSVLQTSIFYNRIDGEGKFGTVYLDEVNGTKLVENTAISRDVIQIMNSIKDMYGFKSEFSYSVSKNMMINSGIQYQTTQRKFDIEQFGKDTIYTYNSNDLVFMGGKKYYVTDPEDVNYIFSGKRNEAAAFTEISFMPLENLNVNAGARYEYDDMTKKSSLSPRISGSYQFNAATSINFAAGLYDQTPEIEYMTTNGVNRNLTLEKSSHFILGVTNYLSTDLRFSAEVYYKNLWNLIVKPAYGSAAMMNSGKGYACGIDLALLKRFSDKYYGQVNYSYSVSKRKDDNNLALYNSSFNQPHIFNLLVGYQFNDNWSVSGKWKYATGRPRDSYMLHSDALNNPDKLRYSMEITSRNSRRFEDYHALHFRVDYRNQFTDNLALIAYLDIMNLYDRANGFQDTLNQVTGKIEVEGSSMVPTIGFKVEF